DAKTLNLANELLTVVAKRRPNWGRVLVAQAHISDLSGTYDTAIDQYQRGMLLGEETPVVIERAVQLLSSRGRFAEANDLFERLRVQKKGSLGGLDRIGAEIALRMQDPTKALTLAEKTVAADSKEYRDHVWLGGIKWAAGKNAEAEA